MKALPPECSERTVEDLTIVLIKYLYTQAEGKCQWALSSKRLDAAYIKCSVCIPAMWGFRLKRQIEDLATRAGIPNVKLVSEPEAAATFIVHSELKPFAIDQRRVHDKINQHAPFLVSDLGGGTTDFITYMYWTEDLTLKMAEGNPGSGT